jgi:hypothetical protein
MSSRYDCFIVQLQRDDDELEVHKEVVNLVLPPHATMSRPLLWMIWM